MINSYSTHIEISVDDTDRNANENKSYINFSETDCANDPGVFPWQISYFTLQGKHDRYNLSGFQNFIPWEMSD